MEGKVPVLWIWAPSCFLAFIGRSKPYINIKCCCNRLVFGLVVRNAAGYAR